MENWECLFTFLYSNFWDQLLNLYTTFPFNLDFKQFFNISLRNQQLIPQNGKTENVCLHFSIPIFGVQLLNFCAKLQFQTRILSFGCEFSIYGRCIFSVALPLLMMPCFFSLLSEKCFFEKFFTWSRCIMGGKSSKCCSTLCRHECS